MTILYDELDSLNEEEARILYNKIRDSKNKKQYYKKNKAYIDARNKAWSVANRDKRLAYERRYQEENRQRVNDSARIYRERHPDKARLAAKRSNLKKKFGISIDEYRELYRIQKGKCAITGRELVIGKVGRNGAALDHNHKTGKIGKFLDATINSALGAFDHNPRLLRAAADYCEKYHDHSL